MAVLPRPIFTTPFSNPFTPKRRTDHGPAPGTLFGFAMPNPAVLFLCTGNSARSQMAEAFLRRLAGDRFDVYSAGSDPKGVHPLTVHAMKEVNIDITEQRSKHLREYLGRLPIQYLIVVCAHAETACPATWPGVVRRLYWAFDDPAAATGSDDDRLVAFRKVRDEIEKRIKDWLDEVK